MHRYGPQNLLVASFAVYPKFTIPTFFRTAVLRKLFDIRFVCKHCYFSRSCLPDKIATRTVTRSISVVVQLTLVETSA